MNRPQLEHILRAAWAITGADRFVVIGSQAILGTKDSPPAELLVSMEADIFSLRSPEDADLIDGTIGELSPFHRTFGYYAHGVDESTAVLPQGWKVRLVPLHTASTGGATGLCLEASDLAISKLVAGRPKDLDYINSLLSHRLVATDVLSVRLDSTALDPAVREVCRQRLARLTRA